MRSITKTTWPAVLLWFLWLSLFVSPAAFGQSGTIQGTVLDPSGAVVPQATVLIRNALTGYQQSVTTDERGAFVLANVPPNPYRLEVSFRGFETYQQDLDVRTMVPADLKISLKLAGVSIRVSVQATAGVLENVPSVHVDVGKEVFQKLPALSPAGGLSDVITMASPGVVAESNGFFHPLGDHAQILFSIDGQPIGDQQSKLFSTQLPLNAVAAMELITGAPGAEYGGKTSLVVNVVTQSGHGKGKPFGSLALQYGSFGSPSEEASLGWGNVKYGNFLAANTGRSGRFLDTPEFQPIHDIGNHQTFFDHFDFKPNDNDSFHLGLMAARNWFQIPNSFDQPAQDQRQKTISYNVAPGYQRILSPTTLLSINAFFRQDQVRYYPSRNPFLDTPATISAARRLTNLGFKGDISRIQGIHNLKTGIQITQTRLRENFGLGLTDPALNPVCVDSAGNPLVLPGITDPRQCTILGFLPNPDLMPGLLPFDLTRGGTLLRFAGRARINEFAFYVQDTIKFSSMTLATGLRVDRYDGLSRAASVQPRIGISYLLKPAGTVFRLSYTRTLETPYNENLILSSATGAGGLAANVLGALGDEPLRPGRRNQFNAGLQQSFGRFFIFDGDYLWKFTDNAYDFDALLNTTLVFPISWRKSKIDSLALRFGTTSVHGLQAYITLGHTRARFFGPELGGLTFNAPAVEEVFRIDHDQAFQQTTNVRYQRPDNGPWFSFTWRYDSGEVAGAITGLEDALSLTAAQQAAIGFFCGNRKASIGNPITSCGAANFGAERLAIPAPGTHNPDTNPARVAPRHLLDLAVGTDNLLRHADKPHLALTFSIVNLTNKVALYNFLSTFSGTHFVAPRTVQAEIRLAF